jgi:hypothetical protein
MISGAANEKKSHQLGHEEKKFSQSGPADEKPCQSGHASEKKLCNQSEGNYKLLSKYSNKHNNSNLIKVLFFLD